MKKLIAGFALVLAATLNAAAQDYSNKKIMVGQVTPDLELPNPTGEMQKLSDIYKGRVVLLDFWASWCGPCRHASPEIVALYKKYKDAKFSKAKKGFTVVSVSLDKSKEAWMGAIAADSLAWPYHLSDLGFWQSKAAEIYGVNSIPQSFLVGPDGKVLAKFSYGSNPAAEIEKQLKRKG